MISFCSSSPSITLFLTSRNFVVPYCKLLVMYFNSISVWRCVLGIEFWMDSPIHGKSCAIVCQLSVFETIFKVLHNGWSSRFLPSGPGSIPCIPKKNWRNFTEKELPMPRLIHSAAAQSSGHQRLNYVDRTHLVLASGNLILH